MHVCVVGTGLAGCALAWQLQTTDRNVHIDLVGGAHPMDATAASGGLVRGFEPDDAACAAAAESLAVLRDSRVMREWAAYHEVGSTYVCAHDGVDVTRRLRTVELCLPGSARLVPAAELLTAGWAGLPESAVAVVEEQAGHVSPGSLRNALLVDVIRRGGRWLGTSATAVRPMVDGVAVACAGEARPYDAVVVAAGRWTPEVLRRAGLDASPYRLKAIQYVVHHAVGELPGAFADETTGLYGRAHGAGRMLVGLPTTRWDVDPDHVPTSAALPHRVRQVAAGRLPGLRLGAACYTDPPGLRLRAALPGHRLYTFTGGSGGAAKTAIAAGRAAAVQLMTGAAVPAGSAGGSRALPIQSKTSACRGPLRMSLASRGRYGRRP
jgi:glycine/D-amino acid oxidase-like deaminating enzyme